MSEHQSAGSNRVVIIGAGFCGIIAGIELKRAGFDNFVIYDREPELGGTWFVNRFPGVAVDTESEIYRLSYVPYNWSRSHAPGDEVLEYMRYAAESHGVADHFRGNKTITKLTWNEDENVYDIELADGEVEQANAVITAVGLLSEPFFPPIAGLDKFRGKVVHTSRWDPSYDYSGKRVAILGTGSTSAQVVPAMAETAGHVTVFQKLAGWVLPKNEIPSGLKPGPVANAQEAAHHDELRKDALRRAADLFADGQISQAGSAQNRAAQAVAEQHLKTSLAARPDLIPLVTPDHPFLGTRPVQSNDFYPALMRDNVTLVPRQIVAATQDALVDSDGVEHSVDMVVLATGFRAAEFLSSLEVVGRDNLRLRDYWGDEPRAYLGVVVPHFPNFFMMYGPNTNSTGALLPMFETQAEFAARTIRQGIEIGAKAMEVREDVFEEFDSWLQQHFENSTFRTAENYFTSKTGRVVTNWPRSVQRYIDMIRAGQPEAMVDVATLGAAGPDGKTPREDATA